MYDHQINPQTIVKPNSFTGLMTLYESNFLRLIDLKSDFMNLEGEHIARCKNENDIIFTITKKEKYTIFFSMSYIFADKISIEYKPNLKIVVYSDGKLVQVTGIDETHECPDFNKITLPHKYIINHLWRKNIILNKWLEHLINLNYKFD